MTGNTRHPLIRNVTPQPPSTLRACPSKSIKSIEQAEGRSTSDVFASFSPALGTLTVIGDGPDVDVELSRDVAGTILVNNGDVPVVGGTPTVDNTSRMEIFGLGSHERLTLNESNGALPRATVSCGNSISLDIGAPGSVEPSYYEGEDTLVTSLGDSGRTKGDVEISKRQGSECGQGGRSRQDEKEENESRSTDRGPNNNVSFFDFFLASLDTWLPLLPGRG